MVSSINVLLYTLLYTFLNVEVCFIFDDLAAFYDTLAAVRVLPAGSLDP
jgi:hypothetical protein